MNIFLGLDDNCISEEKIITGRLGGTERFFLLLWNFLVKKGHSVSRALDKNYDVAIYSNVSSHFVTAKSHICWCGSLHTDAAEKPYDLVIANSKFMLNAINTNGVVIPACYEPQVKLYRTLLYNARTIITTSNPNRHILFTEQVSKLLYNNGVEFTWTITGGNKLYSESFNEHFTFDLPNLQYKLLNRSDLLYEVAHSHVFCYANFEDNSETQCVAAIEAAAMDIPVILPNRLPFTEVLPDNPYFCNTIEDMAVLLSSLLSKNRGFLKKCNVEKYSEESVFSVFYDYILMLGGVPDANR